MFSSKTASSVENTSLPETPSVPNEKTRMDPSEISEILQATSVLRKVAEHLRHSPTDSLAAGLIDQVAQLITSILAPPGPAQWQMLIQNGARSVCYWANRQTVDSIMPLKTNPPRVLLKRNGLHSLTTLVEWLNEAEDETPMQQTLHLENANLNLVLGMPVPRLIVHGRDHEPLPGKIYALPTMSQKRPQRLTFLLSVGILIGANPHRYLPVNALADALRSADQKG